MHHAANFAQKKKKKKHIRDVLLLMRALARRQGSVRRSRPTASFLVFHHTWRGRDASCRVAPTRAAKARVRAVVAHTRAQ